MVKTVKTKVLQAKMVKKAKVKKSASKKPVIKAKVSKKPVIKLAPVQKPIGKVTHFYDQISVAVVALNSALKVDDRIKIGREEPFFEQAVKSMQMDHQNIQIAKKGQEIGLKVRRRVRENDLVFKI